jgi:RNA polymerase sigma-54 factor
MSSLKLNQSLQQRMVLTPQLRQRIEMLQMNTIELNELVQQEMLANPVLEEVQPQEEVQEISENILDHAANGNLREEEEAAARDFDKEFFDSEAVRYKELIESAAATAIVETISAASEPNGTNGTVDNLEDFAEEGFGETGEERRSDAFEEIDYGREFQEYLDPGYKTQEIEHKEDAPSFEQFLTKRESLTEHLEWQLRMQTLPRDLFEIACSIVGNLDGEGRLTATNEEIAEMENCAPERVEQARQIVLQLEPTGCGARDVRECLLVQLAARNLQNRLACELIKHHLYDLQPHKLQHLAKNVGCNITEIKAEIDLIKTLDPYPGRRYAADEAVYIAPEIYIEKIEGEYVIYFADDGSPRLRISNTYQQMLAQKQTSKETRDFIKEKMRSAIDLLRNIEHRRQTIYRVVECIVKRQREFLDKGVQFLKPMMLKDVAEETGMHLSTISRVVNRKYAHTPQGVIELRRFFSEGMLNEDGEEISTRIIKLRIKKLIEEEDSREPVTDDQIAKILAKEGIKLSRRTVAKYRDQMQIAGSRERKVVV